MTPRAKQGRTFEDGEQEFLVGQGGNQKFKSKNDKGNLWILYALGSGVTCGLGNFLLGLKLSHAGAFGPGIAGPLGLIVLLCYRAKTYL